MFKRLSIASLLLFAAISICFGDSVPDIKEGKWEITTKTEMPGMPLNMPPSKHYQCLTKKDLVPQSSLAGQECKITQTKTAGNTVTWHMQCSGRGGDMKGSGNITYSGNSFKGSVKMSITRSNIEMTNHISGQRIGDCK